MTSPTSSRPGRRLWLLAAALLASLLLLALALQLAAPVSSAPEELSRQAESSPPPKTRQEPPFTPTTPRGPRDPIFTALPSGAGKSLMVFDAAAFKRSPVGRLLMECLHAQGGRAPLDELRAFSGVDPTEDLSRIAVSKELVVLEGEFSRARWSELAKLGGLGSKRHGEKGEILKLPTKRRWEQPDGAVLEVEPEAFATWGDQFLLIGLNEAVVARALDRLEGRAPAADPALSGQTAGGEMYGVLFADDLSPLLPPEQAQALSLFRGAAERVELRLDTSRDLGIVAEVAGPDPAQVVELRRGLAAALTFARARAREEGQEPLAQLLGQAEVADAHGRIRLQLSLPLSLVEEQLSNCRR